MSIKFNPCRFNTNDVKMSFDGVYDRVKIGFYGYYLKK